MSLALKRDYSEMAAESFEQTYTFPRAAVHNRNRRPNLPHRDLSQRYLNATANSPSRPLCPSPDVQSIPNFGLHLPARAGPWASPGEKATGFVPHVNQPTTHGLGAQDSGITPQQQHKQYATTAVNSNKQQRQLLVHLNSGSPKCPTTPFSSWASAPTRISSR